MNELKLSLGERLTLRNQYLILRHLDQKEPEHWDKLIRILEAGYEYEYGQLTESFSEPMGEDECREVVDILDMYSALQASRKALGTNGADLKELPFPGFDGNDRTECQYMGYARFLVKDRRFEHVVQSASGFNSHSPRLRQYRDMLKIWMALEPGVETGQRHGLTREQIQRISNR